jgi:ribosome-binding protein aMBF1 (putative translation factor)
MSHQDWTPISIGNPAKKQMQKKIVEKKGDTSIKSDLRKLDNDSETFSLPKIPTPLSKEITNARVSKKLTQKDISVKLNIPHVIYTDIENGKAIYNSQTKQNIIKIEKVLGIKFVHKNITPTSTL